MFVINELETLEKLKQGASICRYGDGEFVYMLDHNPIIYQDYNPLLSQKLLDTFHSNEDNLLIGIPNIYNSLDHLNSDWTKIASWRQFRNRSQSLLKPEHQYYSSFITRPEIITGFMEQAYFDQFAQIWQDRSVVVIGNPMKITQPGWQVTYKTAQEIVNDPLLVNAAKVTYLQAPRVDSFAFFDQLMEQCCSFPKDTIFLIILGPTATVLAADLYRQGYQAIDLGQIMTIYDFFINKVQPKYVSEDEWKRRLKAEEQAQRPFRKNPEYHAPQILQQVVAPEIKDQLVFHFGAHGEEMTQSYNAAGAKVIASLEKDSDTSLVNLINSHGMPAYIAMDARHGELLRELSKAVPLLSIKYTGSYSEALDDCLKEIERLGYTELLGFQMVTFQGQSFCQIVEIDHLDGCRAYFKSLAEDSTGDLLVVNRQDE